MVSCGSQARCAPASAFSAILSWAAGPSAPSNFFRCRRGHRQPRSRANRNIDVEAVAAGDAAGRIDENRREAFGLGRGKADAQRAGFMQMAAAGDALNLVHVEGDLAPRPVGRENRGSRNIAVGPHPPPNGPHRA
jgi:hypothetical protein